MIGHVFKSGATCLALAPSKDRRDEYVVLALTENGYAVAQILTAALGEIGGPTYWMRADYYDHGQNRDDNRRSAVDAFAEDTGMSDNIHLVASVEHAEQVAEHRAHLANA